MKFLYSTFVLIFLVMIVPAVFQAQQVDAKSEAVLTEEVEDINKNQKDNNGLKQGYWEEEDRGELSKGQYVDDKKEGLWKTYHRQGFLKEMAEYKDGELNGTKVVIDRRGYLHSEAIYEKGKLEGLFVEYTYGGRPT